MYLKCLISSKCPHVKPKTYCAAKKYSHHDGLLKIINILNLIEASNERNNKITSNL